MKKCYRTRVQCWSHRWWRKTLREHKNEVKVITRTWIPRFDPDSLTFYHVYVVEAPEGAFPPDWEI